MATATEATRLPADMEKEVTTAENGSVSQGMVKHLDEKILKHSHDADTAMKAFEGMDGQVLELTPEKNRALLRKIDWHLMPVSTTTHVQRISFTTTNANRSCALCTD